MQYNRSFSYPLYVLIAKSSFKIIKLFQALITFCFFPPLDIPSPAKHPQHARASFACHELVALKFAVETYSELACVQTSPISFIARGKGTLFRVQQRK